jgi:hypothetical protein
MDAAQFFAVLRPFPCLQINVQHRLKGLSRGMRHTSTALYFNGASKKSLHKPQAFFENVISDNLWF